jgi:hypothetical protein
MTMPMFDSNTNTNTRTSFDRKETTISVDRKSRSGSGPNIKSIKNWPGQEYKKK